MNKKITKKIQRFPMEMVATIKLGKGKFSPEMLSLLIVDNRRVWVQHKKGVFPSTQDYAGKVSGIGKDWIWSTVSSADFSLLKSAIKSWEDNKNAAMTSYTYIFAFMKAKGVDIHRDLNLM